jgi:hypothetical protein
MLTDPTEAAQVPKVTGAAGGSEHLAAPMYNPDADSFVTVTCLRDIDGHFSVISAFTDCTQERAVFAGVQRTPLGRSANVSAA